VRRWGETRKGLPAPTKTSRLLSSRLPS
jgi:hypothetical protein